MSATVQLDLTNEIARTLAETEQSLSLRKLLASGRQMSVDGRSPIEVTLEAIPIRGRLLADCSGEAFQANPVVSTFPGDQFFRGDQFEAGAEQTTDATASGTLKATCP